LVELIDSLQASLTAIRNRIEEVCRSDNESDQSDQTSLQSNQTQSNEEDDIASITSVRRSVSPLEEEYDDLESIRRSVFHAARLALRPPPLPDFISDKIKEQVEKFQPSSPYSS